RIERELDGHLGIGRGMDVSVADAIEVREHWHPGIVLYSLDQSFAAARNDHVDQPRRAQHGPYRLAVLRRQELNGFGRHAALGKTASESAVNGAVRMHRLAAPSQQHGVAAAQAK